MLPMMQERIQLIIEAIGLRSRSLDYDAMQWGDTFCIVPQPSMCSAVSPTILTCRLDSIYKCVSIIVWNRLKKESYKFIFRLMYSRWKQCHWDISSESLLDMMALDQVILNYMYMFSYCII